MLSIESAPENLKTDEEKTAEKKEREKTDDGQIISEQTE